MLLRKKVQGGRVVEFSKETADRVLILEVEKLSLSNQAERFRLVIRLIPHMLNLFLLDASDEVIGSAFPIANRGGIGEILYRPRSSAGRYIAENITQSQFIDLFAEATPSQVGLNPATTASISKGEGCHGRNLQPLSLGPLAQISGLTPTFRHELQFRRCSEIESLWTEFQLLCRRFSVGPFSPRIYFKSDTLPESANQKGISFLGHLPHVSSPIPLEHLASYRHKIFRTMNELAAELFRNSRATGPVQRKMQTLKSQLMAALKKKHRLRKSLGEDLQKNVEYGIFQKYSNLLYSQPDKAEKGSAQKLIPDLFDASMHEIEIPLDPQLNLIQNANRYARLFQKANRAIPLIQRRIHTVDLEISNLELRLNRLARSAESSEILDEVDSQTQTKDMTKNSSEISTIGKLSVRRQKGQTELASIKKSAKIFSSTDGMEIWVGKNSRENDVLTFKLANPDDFWFHVADYGGSHVVLRNPERLSSAPQQSLKEAAEVAAYFSQARNANKVEVHHTRRKYVTKPRGSKPGLVQLKEHKTVSVRPRCELFIKGDPSRSRETKSKN
jgi:predicted ribosome quality control (RQC) complex YloA/Tae2 family protein